MSRHRISAQVAGSVLSWKGSVGWIWPDGPEWQARCEKAGTKGLFVHKKDVVGGKLTEGQAVQFFIFEDPDGLGAQRVTVAKGKAGAAAPGPAAKARPSPTLGAGKRSRKMMVTNAKAAPGAKRSQLAGTRSVVKTFDKSRMANRTAELRAGAGAGLAAGKGGAKGGARHQQATASQQQTQQPARVGRMAARLAGNMRLKRTPGMPLVPKWTGQKQAEPQAAGNHAGKSAGKGARAAVKGRGSGKRLLATAKRMPGPAGSKAATGGKADHAGEEGDEGEDGQGASDVADADNAGSAAGAGSSKGKGKGKDKQREAKGKGGGGKAGSMDRKGGEHRGLAPKPKAMPALTFPAASSKGSSKGSAKGSSVKGVQKTISKTPSTTKGQASSTKPGPSTAAWAKGAGKGGKGGSSKASTSSSSRPATSSKAGPPKKGGNNNRGGWEKHWSDEFSKYYYWNPRTDESKWA